MVRKGVRKAIKIIGDPFLKWSYNKLALKNRNLRFYGLDILVQPGVFHPSLFFSTKALVQFLSSEKIAGKTLLELGSGTGAISVWAAKQKALVTASDINLIAVENSAVNANKNGVEVTCVHSDLFETLKGETFEYIIINPPYFPKNPTSESEQAWYCGSDFEYFKRLFIDIPLSKETKAFMVLSEDCALKRIEKLANDSGIQFILRETKNYLLEKNYIFQLLKE